MLSKFARHIAAFLAGITGILGVLGVLYAWNLPPFTSSMIRTEDAYVRGHVTPMAPQVSGIIAEVAVQDYQRVKKGDLLVKIDDSTYVQQLAQARAQLASAEAALDGVTQSRYIAMANIDSAAAAVAAAEAGVAGAQSHADRASNLRARGVVTDSEAEDMQLELDRANAVLRQARAQSDTARQQLEALTAERNSRIARVEEAKAAVALAEIDLAETRISAPIDGRLGEVSAQVGQYVSTGTRLLTVVSDDIWVVANFKETQVHGLKIGQPVYFTVDAFDGAELVGHIEQFSPATGSQFSVLGSANATGNFIKIVQRLPVRISIDRDQGFDHRLVPGLSVVVRADRD